MNFYIFAIRAYKLHEFLFKTLHRDRELYDSSQEAKVNIKWDYPMRISKREHQLESARENPNRKIHQKAQIRMLKRKLQ